MNKKTSELYELAKNAWSIPFSSCFCWCMWDWSLH